MFRFAPLLILSAVVIAPSAAAAQPAGQQSASRWQVTLVGGLSLFDLPTTGDAALPPSGPSLPTSGPTNPSRRVPTWFLDDGASLLNGTNAEFGVAARLQPLDPVIGRLGLTGSNAPVIGVRAARRLTPRWALEAAAEVHVGSVELDAGVVEAAHAAAASFGGAFVGLFSTGPFTNTQVSAGASVSDSAGQELILTAAVRYDFGSTGLRPYVLAGGGLIQRVGDLPHIRLQGDYRFTFATSQGSASFAESDALTLRYAQRTAAVGLAGAGVSSRVTNRVSLTLDGRVYLNRSAFTLLLDSSPSVTGGTPPGVIESFTTPAVQSSNNASTGRDSTLSGAPLEAFEAFVTSGLQVRVVVTAGLTIRF